MERILLLNDKQFPKAFETVTVEPKNGKTKVVYVEECIKNAINQYNPKIVISKIEYLKIEDQFPCFKKSVSNGLLIEEVEIDSLLTSRYQNNGCYVFTIGGKTLCRRIIYYIYVSATTEGTRTAYVSQTIFPTLLDYAADNIDSPSFSIANHKFCYLDICAKTITAKMILRQLASLYEMGIEYIDVFNSNSLCTKAIPKDIKDFLQAYTTDFDNYYNTSRDCFENDYYRVDFTKKQFLWKAVPASALEEKQYIDFNGSSEKFYWTETLPMAIMVYKRGYEVDFGPYEKFVNDYKPKFSPKSEKFMRCTTLLDYIKKYFV